MTSESYFRVAEREDTRGPGPADPGVPSRASITLLGAFGVSFGGVALHLSRGVERLIALVALAERPLPRAEAAAMLWPDSSEERAAASLRTVLWRLQRSSPMIIQANATTIRLSPSALVDLWDLHAAARRIQDPASQPSGAEVGSFTRDLLPGWYEDWVVVERDRLKLVRLQALETLGERYTQAGRLAQAESCYAAAVSIEPLRENAHRALVRTLIDRGNPGEALLRYRAYRVLLDRELHVPPSEEMEEIVRRIRSR